MNGGIRSGEWGIVPGIQSCEIEPRSWRGVLDTTVCDKACQ
jgi:hypothetical protein